MDTGQIVTVASVIITGALSLAKMHYDAKRVRDEMELAERRRIADREWQLQDRMAAAQRTADHRAVMSEKLDKNTAITEKVADQTNGVTAKLVELTEVAAFAKGKLAGSETPGLPTHIDVTILPPADSPKVLSDK